MVVNLILAIFSWRIIIYREFQFEKFSVKFVRYFCEIFYSKILHRQVNIIFKKSMLNIKVTSIMLLKW